MMTTKSAKKQIKSIKKAAVEQMSHITTNEKIAGAAAIGVVVGAAATAIGSAMLHGSDAEKTTKAVKKPTA
jgi:ABC-type tungstate transport system substrate-binding protein